jgi:D-3-phosphoglycerate dehydrogenase
MAPSVTLQKDKIKIVLLEGVHPSAVDCLQRQGYHNIEQISTALSDDALVTAIEDAHFVGIRSRTQLTDKVLQQAPKLTAIGCFCIGTNQVDAEAAKRLGIPVFNAPFSNTRSVAELVLANIIMLLRRVPEKNAACHRGEWQKNASGSHEARGKTLGIIGYGHIGTQLGILAEQLGMQVQYYDIEEKLSLGNAFQVASLEKLLASSDVVSLHVPETRETRNLIGTEQLTAMRKGAMLVNASRGTVVDIDALVQALDEKHLSGAAIDVFPVEPKATDDEFVSPLRAFDNVILTPHIGGSTQEAQENIGVEVAGKLAKYSDNGSTLSAVNFPEVSLPVHEECNRLLHIHKNQPGVLRQVNQTFADLEINIAAQYLQTESEIGYVVIDIDSDQADTVLHRLKAIDGTIRCRLLR